MVYTVSTVSSGVLESTENATCPVCSRIFKIRYVSTTKELKRVEECSEWDYVTISCRKYKHEPCGSVLLVSNS